MDSEKILTPQESLIVIEEAIAKAKENFRENSFGFLLWGWLIATASLLYFLLEHWTDFPYYFIPFPVLAATGIIITLLYFKKKNNEKTQTYSSYFINKMWAVLGLAFITVVFINTMQGKTPFTYTLIVAGAGTLVSGWVMKFQPLIIGGIVLFGSALLSIYFNDSYKPLLHGAAIVAGYLVPGYLLKSSKA